MAHILVVDDDDLVAELAAAMLRSAGHVCGCAADATLAGRMLHWRRPDLLLLDDAMPDDGSASLLHGLRAGEAFRTLPVLLLAMRDDGEDGPRALLDGAQGVISKPLQPQVLQRQVDAMLQAPPLAERAEFQLRTRKGAPARKVYL